jgi:hypothetical protein
MQYHFDYNEEREVSDVAYVTYMSLPELTGAKFILEMRQVLNPRAVDTATFLEVSFVCFVLFCLSVLSVCLFVCSLVCVG